MHVVHINAAYDNFTDATNHKDGLLVLSFVFEVTQSTSNLLRCMFVIQISDMDNNAMEAVVETIAKVVTTGAEEQVDQNITIMQLLPDTGFDTKFYYYQVHCYSLHNYI